MSDPAQTVTVGAMSYQVSDSMGDSIIKRYSQMYSFWHVNRRQSVDIFVQGHAKPFRVPMDWLHRSGFLIWSFVVEVLGLFVNESGSLFRPDTAAGTPILPTEDVTAGQYVFKPDSGEFTWRNGPYGPKIHGVAPSPEDMDLATSESISVASSVRTHFRSLLSFRDSGCLLTGVKQAVGAAHLVPRSRPDIYATVLGDDYNDIPYETSHGVLLADQLHTIYDQRILAFYTRPDDPNYYVQCFREGIGSGHHGTVIPLSIFSRTTQEYELPDKRLCRWHWEQCVLQNIRGFAANPRIGETAD